MPMTRTEFIRGLAAHEPNAYYHERLNYCKATVFEFPHKGFTFTVLKSYNTIVAAYLHELDRVLVLGNYSATTWQHVNKFIKSCAPWDVRYLCKRSDNLKSRDALGTTEYWTKAEYQKALDQDFEWFMPLYYDEFFD